MKLGTHIGLGPGYIVLNGDPAPLPQRGTAPSNFRPISFVAKWMDELRCYLVGGKPRPKRHCVRYPAPLHKKGAEPPMFGPCLLWPNGWMDQDATWYGVRLRPAGIVLDGGPAPPQRRGTTSPTFQPISVVAKRLDASRCQVRR